MVKLIAEIGFNFLGDLSLARTMISEAARAGADIVKFQTWQTKYLKPGPWDADGRREIYEKAELSDADHAELADCCRRNGVEFLTSIFSEADAARVARWCKKIKIPSAEIANTGMLTEVNATYDEVYLSTGASNPAEIHRALQTLFRPKVTLLHCVSSYPCPDEIVNLPRIEWLKYFGRQVGYSGHATGIDDAIASLEYGVTVIEKHFTTDNNLPGRDNKFAVLPADFARLSGYIRRREAMTVDRGPDYQPKEQEIRDVYRGRWQL